MSRRASVSAELAAQELNAVLANKYGGSRERMAVAADCSAHWVGMMLRGRVPLSAWAAGAIGVERTCGYVRKEAL